MNIANWLARAARLRPEAPALLDGAVPVARYGELLDRVRALAGWLRNGLGVGAGDRVAFVLKNRPEYLELMQAAWWAGAVVVPVNVHLHASEVAWILSHAGARVAIVEPDAAPALAQAAQGARVIALGPDNGFGSWQTAPEDPADRAPGDLAWLFYTSGTTGRPKGAMLPHGALSAMALAYFTDVEPILPTHAALYAAPLSHGAGLYSLPHMLAGARHVTPRSGGFDAAEVLALARDVGDVSMFCVPTMVRRLVDAATAAGADAGGLRTIVYGGGPMYLADILEAVDRLGPRFIQIYGQGESPMTITALPRGLVADRSHARWRERLGSVGRPHACVDVQTRDPTGAPTPPGVAGEVAVRGPTVMDGYWEDPAATAAALRDGWLHTGDIGVFDEDGFLSLVDRSKDVIISGGSNIYPREVEEVLLAHPLVREVAVIGRPSAEWGEEVVAFVVPLAEGGVSAADLDARCLAALARFKRPKTYVFTGSLPKNANGKVLKSALRADPTAASERAR